LERYSFLLLPVVLAASYAIAALSWYLLEKPFLNLKRYFDAKPGGPASLGFSVAADRDTVRPGRHMPAGGLESSGK
jgi:peptidoglycan/LPS O-acetylase OafA/YrhL